MFSNTCTKLLFDICMIFLVMEKPSNQCPIEGQFEPKINNSNGESS